MNAEKFLANSTYNFIALIKLLVKWKKLFNSV